ncbi:hypothetical protein SAMN06297251_11258 [Fulvimarina manganoxydans]|uniref:Uncharacterized protein n=1 Tax=Fulvimarina manganoxydans TaxID=937218 RepID=A0A1W2D383_9HYPH|nr:hypothetical protein [Fulvimarina manganoxydans]MEE2951927.1 hypothetical protein [Pseudomonadota bacterium]SMC91498.1 hypothetical protein SAMN06297251_11258 [Fulvimarina manganoxydans]
MEMAISLDVAIDTALEDSRQSGVLIFCEATARASKALGRSDAVLLALVERRILQEAHIRGIPVLFSPIATANGEVDPLDPLTN